VHASYSLEWRLFRRENLVNLKLPYCQHTQSKKGKGWRLSTPPPPTPVMVKRVKNINEGERKSISVI